jgi:hypothetical protein
MTENREVGKVSNRVDVLNAELKNYGVEVDTYSPGDGVTRYRFFKIDPGADYANDYFAGYGLYTALGWKEAVTFATGWRAGMEQALASVGMVP